MDPRLRDENFDENFPSKRVSLFSKENIIFGSSGNKGVGLDRHETTDSEVLFCSNLCGGKNRKLNQNPGTECCLARVVMKAGIVK